MEAIRATCDELQLAQQERQIKKILEFNEQLQQRMGVVVVGPSGTGIFNKICVCLTTAKSDF